MNVIYFAHDITHADIPRRIDMLRKGGSKVTLFGFHRKSDIDYNIADKVVGLGQTQDANFLQRIAAILRTFLRLSDHAASFAGGDVVLARNLEMLLLCAVVRARFLPGRPLIYECLDIHRLMTQRGLAGRALRWLEARLIRRSQAIVTSSPGFVREYFARNYAQLPTTMVVENKIFPAGAEGRPAKAALPPGPPWRIGWYGVIRCRRSLEILSEVARRSPGLIEVVVAGRPSRAVFTDIEADFSGIPGLRYIGGFADEAELGRLFASVHFAWAMDFFEEGANSDWLLPNRLYRAAYYGAVPISQSTVETGRWLAAHQAGLRLDQANATSLIESLQAMTADRYAALQANLDDIPTTNLVTEVAECESFVRSLQRPGTVPFPASRTMQGALGSAA